MTLKNDTTPAAPAAANEGAAPTAEDLAQKAVSRRMMFGGGMLGVATFLAAACSGSDFSSGTKNGRKQADGGKGKADNADSDDDDSTTGNPGKGTATAGTPGAGTAGGTPDGGVGDAQGTAGPGIGSDTDGTGLTECHANNANVLDTSGIEDASGDMVPDAKFYGTKRSCLIALKFKTAMDLKQVIVTREDGTLLALHGISAADKNGTSWRPIVVDNIWVGDSGSIIVLMQLGTERKKCKIPVAFFTSFNSNQVQDLSQMTVPNGFVGKQAVCQFNDPSGAQQDTNAKYPNAYGNPDRYLQTAQSGSTWGVGAATNPGGACTFTDVMGNVIDVSGAGILEYQVFCAYFIAGGIAYRTMLHIG